MGFLSGISSFIEKHSEAVHAVPDVAGFIPVVSAVADIANTTLYIHEGDAGNAIMCCIAAIPGIGGLASLARKSYNAFKTSKTGIKVINALKKYEGVEKILSSLRGKMKTGAKRLNKLSEGFESLFDRIKNLLKHICIKKGRCFTDDTLETMEGTACITKIIKERHEEPVTVYNLSVKDWVSYFVGKVRVYVHNGNGYKSGSKSITVSQDRLQHSVLGEFNSNGRLINGGHGQANINFLNQNNIEYNIVKVYDNGVRVGNIPSHKNKFKRTGTGQAWFPESWTEIDIKNAGEYVANIPENVNIPDGTWVFGEYNGVRVGIIKNNGEIGTIIPDNSRQP